MLPLLLLFSLSPGQAAHAWRQAHESEILKQFYELLSIPNVASDKANIGRNADWLVAQLKQRGVSARLLPSPDAPPVVLGEWNTPGAKQTFVFYAHYDGQPVEPAKWTKSEPFHPTMIGNANAPDQARIYGRSTSDDKGVIIAMLAAIDALQAAKIAPKSNIKFFFEGEEEAGSPHLGAIIERYRDLLAGESKAQALDVAGESKAQALDVAGESKAQALDVAGESKAQALDVAGESKAQALDVAGDLWMFCDGPVHQSGRQQIVFGARGDTSMEIVLYGARRELHSGHYGNWAPNPAMELAQLLAGMKDKDGRVTIEHFYDGVEPLGPTEKRALAAIPNIDPMLKDEMGIGWTEGAGDRLDNLIQLPSLTVRGMLSSSVGATARNVIPAEATASLDLRLVKGLDSVTQVDRVIAHIRKQGYFVTDQTPDDAMRRAHPRIARVRHEVGYNAQRTPMDLPVSRQLIAAVEAARGPVVLLPTSGGSLPLILFEKILHVPVIVLPIANYDNNQHSSDENIRLQNLWDGIETMAAAISM